MRTLVFVAAALALGSCGRELNSEYCVTHPRDNDCINAGLTVVDAPSPCTMDEQCAGMAGNNVCDTGRQQCVECTATDQPACTSSSTYCASDDKCHQCLTDANCPDGVCLPDLTCASSGSLLYASPAGTGDCTSAIASCTLTTAISKLDAAHGVILLAPGDYTDGPHVISRSAALIGKGASDDPKLTSITNAAGQHGPVLTVQGGVAVTLDYLTVHGSDTDGVACQSSSLTFFRCNSYGNANFGVASAGCTLDVERAELYTNNVAAIDATDSTITITNDFIYDNGNSNQTGGGAVRLRGATKGELSYNSIAFNTYKSNQHPGLTCTTTAATKVEFNIVAGNKGKGGQLDPASPTCLVSPINFISDNADEVKFKSANPPYDLHLTDDSQDASPKVIDNAAAVCTSTDFDGDMRPLGPSCDLGADEHALPGQ